MISVCERLGGYGLESFYFTLHPLLHAGLFCAGG